MARGSTVLCCYQEVVRGSCSSNDCPMPLILHSRGNWTHDDGIQYGIDCRCTVLHGTGIPSVPVHSPVSGLHDREDARPYPLCTPEIRVGIAAFCSCTGTDTGWASDHSTRGKEFIMSRPVVLRRRDHGCNPRLLRLMLRKVPPDKDDIHRWPWLRPVWAGPMCF